MITQRKIDDLVQELKDGGFYCTFVNKKLNVIFKGTRIMVIDFERRVIEFGQRPINPNDNPRFSYFMGRIWGVLWVKEEKFRLKSQLDGNTKQGFMSDLIVCRNSTATELYFLSNKDYSKERHIQTEFTKSEIEEMPFDTKFFIKEEVK